MARKLSKVFPLIEVLRSVDVTYEGKQYSVQWTNFYLKEDIGRPPRFPPLLSVVDDKGDDLESTIKNITREVKLIAIEHRMAELREELGDSPITSLAEIQKILDRVWAGEWMGQFEYGGEIYLLTLRDILNLGQEEFWPIFDTLLEKGMVRTVEGSRFLYNPQPKEYLD